jgi:hypothetical protein
MMAMMNPRIVGRSVGSLTGEAVDRKTDLPILPKIGNFIQKKHGQKYIRFFGGAF